MKCAKIFLISSLLLSGCHKEEEEEVMNLDQMALAEEEMNTDPIAGEPVDSPQETLR